MVVVRTSICDKKKAARGRGKCAGVTATGHGQSKMDEGLTTGTRRDRGAERATEEVADGEVGRWKKCRFRARLCWWCWWSLMVSRMNSRGGLLAVPTRRTHTRHHHPRHLF